MDEEDDTCIIKHPEEYDNQEGRSTELDVFTIITLCPLCYLSFLDAPYMAMEKLMF